MRDIFTRKYGDENDMYICRSCKNKFISDVEQETLEFLARSDKFDWYRSDESSGDWRRGLFCEPYRGYTVYSSGVMTLDKGYEGTKIVAINGEIWTDDVYREWEKRKQQEEEEERIRKQQKEEEELNHKRLLEEARKQQKIDEEVERERTRKANELFFARHQLNTPTQRYINKFCSKDSNVDITNWKIQDEALMPKYVNFDTIQKHNCTLYREYLQSPLWKIISSKVKWNANNRCDKCGSEYNLQVHHTSYEFKGVEFLAFETLKCLCSKCHKEEHKKQNGASL